jgi:transglutaminase-like putative cysteine protease
MLLSHTSFAGINTNSAYIQSYLQRTEISIKDTFPTVKTTHEIVFKFNDEKAISLYHTYSLYTSYFEKLDDIEVYTKNPQPNGKTKTIQIKDFTTNHMKDNSIFYNDEMETTINFLGLTVGSEAYITYTTSTNECHFTEPMTFSYYMPVQERKFELIVPKEVNISLIEKNIKPTTFKFTKDEKRSETKYTWIATDIEEDKPMDNLPARMAYTPHVLYKIDDFTYKGRTIAVAKTPKDLFDWYVKNIKHINQKPSERILSLADSITKGCITDREKVIRVYDWVKKNIRYVAFENGMEGLIPREAELVCNRRYGDCKDMSSLQYGLLRAIKVPACLTWIGTRRIPYTYDEVPLINTDNHMIAAVKLDGIWHFLDATDPNGYYDIPSDHIQGKQAMIYKSNNEYELVMVPIVDANKNTFIETNRIKLDKSNANISTEATYKGLLANGISNQLLYMTESDKQEYGKGIIKGISNNAVLEKFTVEKPTDSRDVNYAIDFKLNNYAKEVGDEMYVNLLLDQTLNNLTIKEPNRTIPFSIKYNSSHEITYYLTIPTNYKVDYLPTNFVQNESTYGATITYEKTATEIICKQKVFVNFPELQIMPNQFMTWNKFIKQLNKTYKESITLKKI